jgi:AcrR family transcriptional regulator
VSATRDRLVAAAAAEFAARGFDGAKVDRIAAKARVNKAMLYYHFESKAALYREILRELFSAVAAAVETGRRAGGAPGDQIRRFVEAVAREAVARPHFPAIWLREVAEGGRHLDATTLAEMRRVVETLGAILANGRAAGVFGQAHPIVTQIAIVAPLLLFVASAPLRERFKHLLPEALGQPSLDAIVAHVQAATLSVLTAGSPPTLSPSGRRRA